VYPQPNPSIARQALPVGQRQAYNRP
jgi:hypothetical protein